MSLASVWMLAAALVASGAAERFAGTRVSRVDLVSEGGALPEAAENLVEIDAGDAFDLPAVRRSIKQLFALGAFSDIKVEAEREGDGVALTFRLYPTLRVADMRILGLEKLPPSLERLSRRILKEARIERGSLFEARQVEEMSARIEKELAREGFYEASVEPEADFKGPEASVRFHVRAGRRTRLGSLLVHGAPPQVERDIRQKLSIAPGDPYSRRRVDQDIERLVDHWKARGFYGARVTIREQRVAPDTMDLDLDVELGPRVLIQVEGARLSDRALSRLLPILRERSTSSDLVEESRGNLEEHFREQGNRDAVVRVDQSRSGGGRYMLLTFRIERGERYRVGKLRIEGLSSFPVGQLQRLIKSRSRPLLARPFRPMVWQSDLEEIRNLLRQQGFHRAVVRGETDESSASPGRLDLLVRIEEGPRAFIEVIDVEGAKAMPSTGVLAASGLQVGSPFYAPAIVESRERIINFYRDHGYRDVDVEVQTALDETQTQASVSFRIREGKQTFVGRVIVSGLEVTREEALRRQITLVPRAPLSSADLLDTRQRLVGTGLFRKVDVDVLEEHPAERSRDVLIRLEEGPRTSFGYGFGYNERELARVETELTRRNLFGLTRTVSVFGRASLRGGRFITTYRQPELFGYNLPMFFSAFYEQESRASFDYIRRGVGFQLSKRLSEDRSLILRYSYNRTRVFRLEVLPEELPREFRNISLSTVSASLVTDTRDDPITPRRGQFRLLDFEVSARGIGSKSPYVKGLAQQFFYFPLPLRMVGAVGLRLGIGQTFRQDRDALLPITERFFAGGANTLRGFGLDRASPRDALGNAVGGNVLTLLNLELRFPIAGKLGGVLFSDNGTVYRRLQVIQLLNWRHNVGFGLRYDTPLGPLRVDWGFKIDTRPGEPPSRLHVSLGHAF